MEDTYKALFESTKATLGVTEEALKAVTKDNDDLTAENNKLQKRIDSLEERVKDYQRVLDDHYFPLEGKAARMEQLLVHYRAILKDMMADD